MERTNFKEKIRANAKIQLLRTPKNRRTEKRNNELTKEEGIFERDFVTGCIVNDDFCAWARENFPPKYVQAKSARKLIFRIYNFFDKYEGKAPYRDIESLIYSNEAGFHKEEILDFEDILGGLSQEWVEEKAEHFNFSYLKERTKHRKLKNDLRNRTEQVQGLLKNNDLEDALELFQFNPPTLDTPLYIQTIAEIKEEGVERPPLLMKPWLRAGETNILYSVPGAGKSLLALLVSYLLGLENYQEPEAEIAEWQVKRSCGALYIDGEMGKAEIIDRMEKFKWLGKQKQGYEMRLFSIPDYQMRTEKDFNLAKRENQKTIIKWLKQNPNYKFLVVDSISTVFNLEDENSNSEWNKKINPFLKDLRALGVGHLIQHHSGKDGKLRGASAMTAMAHNVFRLQNHPKKSQGQAWFKIDNNEKQRAAGKLFDPFYMKFIDNGEETEWEITDAKEENKDGNKKKAIMAEIIKGKKKNKEIAEMFGCKAPYITQVKNAAKEAPYKYLDARNNATEAGREFLNEYLGRE